MKLLIATIIILIIIVIIIIIGNNNIYFSEDFANQESSYNQNTIEDLIDFKFIPDDPDKKEEISEYDVIELYRKILDRPPTADEIRENVMITKDKLLEDLYNSFEYDKLVKLQNNEANNHIESSIAKRNLILKLTEIYKKTYKKEVPEKMVMPIRDCYIHLRSNQYLFLVMIESKNFVNFERDVLTAILLSKKVLLELFNKHFNLLELKLLAQDRIKIDRKSKDISFTKVKEDLDKLYYSAPIKNTKSLSTNSPSAVNLDDLKAYLQTPSSPAAPPLVSSTETPLSTSVVNNKLILKEGYENKDSKSATYDLNDILKTREPENLKVDVIKNLPKDSELYVRVYDPINYKQTYRGNGDNKNFYRPPICTSLGQAQLTTPIFIESKLLFQGTDINQAFAETQVGSIMPKFTYREYQDIRVQ